MNTRSIKSAAVIAASLILTACASMQRPPQEPIVVPDPVTESLPDGSIRFDTRNEQVARLWMAAEKARQENRESIALELILQALDIDSSSALLWSRAAELQLDNLEAALAENYAVKSNSFAANNESLMYRNWLIIEHARSMRGDLLGVRSAHKKVQQYRYQ